MDASQVNKVLTFLNASWPSRPLDPTTAAIWGSKLRDYDFAATMAVLDRLLETSRWRPSFAEVVGPMRPESTDSATAAFESIWSQIGKRPPQVTGLEQQAVNRMGGWETLGRWRIDDRHWHFSRFKEVWRDLGRERDTGKLRALASGEPPPALPEDRSDVAANDTPNEGNEDYLSHEEISELVNDFVRRVTG